VLGAARKPRLPVMRIIPAKVMAMTGAVVTMSSTV
jgi:hypothetical protein